MRFLDYEKNKIEKLSRQGINVHSDPKYHSDNIKLKIIIIPMVMPITTTSLFWTGNQ